MKREGYYMDGETVQLDLAKIESALANGMASVREDTGRLLADLRDSCLEAYKADHKDDERAAYHAKCSANCIAPRLTASASTLENLVEAWFHVSQARVRDTVTIDKGE